jgi:hypothetical protein
MSRRTLLVRLLALVAGVGLMSWSSRMAVDCDELTPGMRPVIYVAEEVPAEKPAKRGEKEMAAAPGVPVVVRFLPADPEVAQVADLMRKENARAAGQFLRRNQEMMILLPPSELREEMLASGRLPAAGAREVVAGHAARGKDQVVVAGESFQVVGQLKREDPPLANAYLLPSHPAQSRLFGTTDQAVRDGRLVFRSKDAKPDPEDEFPKERFTALAGVARLERPAFYAYMAGFILLLAGGLSLLAGAYHGLSRRATGRWLGPPLAEIARRRKLFVGLHVAYFGACVTAMLLIYELPWVQDALLGFTVRQVRDEPGLLNLAGKAYATKNVAIAAGVTVAINFLAGSLLMITTPSLVVPGVGLLVAMFRAMVWGVLLAPTSEALAQAMVLHSGTLLLEGEGYVLATFFAVLVPIYLFGRGESGVASRYGQALLVNLKGNLLVLVVLALAAIYEAIEVILQMSR